MAEQTKIDDFRGKYFFLSNFYSCMVEYEGKRYQSAEAAFQAAKTLDEHERSLFTELSPSQAKQRGRRIPLRDDWEDIKVQVMRDVCFAKFSQNESLKQRLLDTGDAMLEEGNNWGDTFWGIVAGYGENQLGKVLMGVRSALEFAENYQHEMELHEADYQKIRADIDASFPQWKKDLCNDVLLTSKHSEKL